MPQTKIRNPFIHSHEHDHDHAHGDGHHHHHDHEPFEPTDPAQQSLADALRVSFTILKWAMALLFVAYIFTGLHRVEEQDRAVRLRFGSIVGDVHAPGWHFGLPYPVEQWIDVPVSPRLLNIDRTFWYAIPRGGEGLTEDELAQRAGPLNPERDGSLVTGDANVIHGRFQIVYRVPDRGVPEYVRNVGTEAVAEQIVRNVAEQGIVFAVAQVQADDMLRQVFARDAAIQHMQRSLDEMRTGIVIESFTIDRAAMPLPVRTAYQAVINAESERAQAIEGARQRYTRTLNEAAGEGYQALYQLVQQYEMARALGEEAQAEALAAQIDQALETLVVEGPSGPVRISGNVATIINQARTERTQTVERVRAEATRFQSLLAQYRQNPRVVRQQLWQNTQASILTGDVETIYAPTGEALTLTTNRDPEVQRQRERERLQREQEAAAQRSQQQNQNR